MFDRDSLAIIAARKRDVLSKLQLLSDARAAQPVQAILDAPRNQRRTRTSIPGVNSAKGHADSAPPPDVDMECLDKHGPPPKTFSLYAHYRWRFDEAARMVKHAEGDERQRWLMRTDALCSMAYRDLLAYTGKAPRPMGDTDTANVGRLLTEYRGVPAHEVAVWEMCSVAWVRKSRRLAGVDPELGEERADERTQRIVALAGEGKTQQAIAREVGISQARVSRVLAAA